MISFVDVGAKSRLGMAVLPAGAGIRGYPTRRAWVRVEKSARGRGYGHQNPLAGAVRASTLTRGYTRYPHLNKKNPFFLCT
jgi:hypothetical protein